MTVGFNTGYGSYYPTFGSTGVTQQVTSPAVFGATQNDAFAEPPKKSVLGQAVKWTAIGAAVLAVGDLVFFKGKHIKNLFSKSGFTKSTLSKATPEGRAARDELAKALRAQRKAAQATNKIGDKAAVDAYKAGGDKLKEFRKVIKDAHKTQVEAAEKTAEKAIKKATEAAEKTTEKAAEKGAEKTTEQATAEAAKKAGKKKVTLAQLQDALYGTAGKQGLIPPGKTITEVLDENMKLLNTKTSNLAIIKNSTTYDAAKRAHYLETLPAEIKALKRKTNSIISIATAISKQQGNEGTKLLKELEQYRFGLSLYK